MIGGFLLNSEFLEKQSPPLIQVQIQTQIYQVILN